MEGSQGSKFIKMAPNLEEFWRHEPISEDQFLEKADTFDVLLFRCNFTGAKLQRQYTRSDYDHVAMLLRFDSSNSKEIYILEATGNQGVGIKKWSSMKRHYGDFYSRIVFRHINGARADE